MERRYRLIQLQYHEHSLTESTILGEFTDRTEMEKEIETRRWKNILVIDFLIDGTWYRGNINSRDPIAWGV